MFHAKKYFLMIMVILCLCPIHMIGQTDYYYYKGEKIPLIEKKDKVCLSIPKGKDALCEIIKANVKVEDKITDNKFDIFIIECQDVEIISSMEKILK